MEVEPRRLARRSELILTVAPALVGAGPALADGEFSTPRFRLAELAPFGEKGVRLRYERRVD